MDDNGGGGLLKLGVIDDATILKCLHNVVLIVRRQEEELQKWRIFSSGFSLRNRYFARVSCEQGGDSQDTVATRLKVYCAWKGILPEAH